MVCKEEMRNYFCCDACCVGCFVLCVLFCFIVCHELRASALAGGVGLS